MSSHEAATAWDGLARVYNWQLPLERRSVAAAVELADVLPHDRVLDVATGTGAVLMALARLRPPPAVAIGLDSSEEMMARVPSLPAGWSLERGDVISLPFPVEQFDVVIASHVLHLLNPAQLDRALSEMRRVLKPGGRAVAVTPVAPRSCLGPPYRRIMDRIAHFSESSLGLRPMDPRPRLPRFGLKPVRARYVHRGYPSLCVLARATGW